MTKNITVNGKTYEMTIGFRELINAGATSVSMDDKDIERVCADIKSFMLELEDTLYWLNTHNKNYTKLQEHDINDAYTFVSDINRFGVFHNL